MLKKSLIALAICSMSIGVAQARDQITIVGSSTVFPFSSYVAEEFGATSSHPTPVVESTGSGGGMKLFCAGANLKTPDFTNASRRMKTKEFETCQKNGVMAITEAMIGYDGIALAQSKKNKSLVLSRKDILLAVAKEVPNKAGTALVANPYKFWDQVNAALPHRPIVVYGPPTTSGTRDAFEDLAMKALTKKMAVYKAVTKKYHKIRQDGVYVPSGENDNLIVQKLIKDKDAIGIFGYSFLEENSDQISAASIDGSTPSPASVASGSYPLSRSLYFYIKHNHIGKVSGIKEYTHMFMSEDMIGDEGQLSEIGLIPAANDVRSAARAIVTSLKKLTLKDLQSK